MRSDGTGRCQACKHGDAAVMGTARECQGNEVRLPVLPEVAPRSRTVRGITKVRHAPLGTFAPRRGIGERWHRLTEKRVYVCWTGTCAKKSKD